jgi:hypothetical protein
MASWYGWQFHGRPTASGATLFLGNPPYVRHHGIDGAAKDWLAETAAGLGHRASRLAGMHVHFLLKTATLARDGDYGAFVTSAEWLDVNYGALVRDLLLNTLGGVAVDIIDAAARPFPFVDAATTAAVLCFRAGSRLPAIRLRKVRTLQALAPLGGGRPVPRSRLLRAPRWSALLRPSSQRPSGHIELGEICRVHRGQVTGCNRVWIRGARGHDYPHDLPAPVLSPAVTRAAELLAQFALTDAADRSVKTYSGGMRRRLDLAASMVARPKILFLDEPTTGLDARARIAMWETIRELVSDGTTLLLTTQYLEEADELADQIVVIDHGRVIAEGTADQLKANMAADFIDITIANPLQVAQASDLLRPLAAEAPQTDELRGHVVLSVESGVQSVAEVVRLLDGEDIPIAELNLRRPTLNDVFLSITGEAIVEEEAKPKGRGFGRRRSA